MKKGIDYIGVSVGAIILNDKGEVLLTKRSMQTRNEQGKWEAPGGAVDFGEVREDAIKREISEELDVDIELQEVLNTADEILPQYKQHWIPTTYIAKIKKGQKPRIVEPHKCDEIGWFSLDNLPTPLSYITELDLNIYKKKLEQYSDASVRRGRYQHYKGGISEVIGVAKHTETGEEFVSYYHEDQQSGKMTLWVRPKKMFLEKVTINGKKVPRFQYIDTAK